MERRGLELVDPLRMRTADLELMGKNRRTDMMHISTVLREMKRAAGGNVEPIEGEVDGYRAQLGFLLERALEKAWQDYWTVEWDQIDWQTELEWDGLIGTPDGLDQVNRRTISVKLTWISARKWEQDYERYFRWWLAQEMAYAWMWTQMSGEPVLEALYIVGFVNGDYKGWPRLGPYTDVVRWTYEEMADNWAAIKAYQKWMEEGA